jgi:hypothetical protein
MENYRARNPRNSGELASHHGHFRVGLGERLSVEIAPGFCSGEAGRLLYLVVAIRAP